MAPRPKWWHTLQEARRQALLGVDFYNRPGDKRSFYDFVVHMHLAWQNLLHADLERRKVDYYYRDKRGRYVKGKDGERRTWELQECLKREFKDNSPVRSTSSSSSDCETRSNIASRMPSWWPPRRTRTLS